MTASKPEFDVVIPARYESSRLPGKLLCEICGKTMIQRVVERAFMSSAQQVCVAVDDERIADNVSKMTDAVVVFTSPDHMSGSDRIAEAVQLLGVPGSRTIVNVQGDEPLIDPDLIDCVAEVLQADSNASIGTAAKPMDLKAFGSDPNRVKCVVDRNNRALYFSRSAIPSIRDSCARDTALGLAHIGIYAYTADYLVNEHARRESSPLEKAERLEQLRALYHGDTIAVHIDRDYQGHGVDTQRDLEKVREIIAGSGHRG